MPKSCRNSFNTGAEYFYCTCRCMEDPKIFRSKKNYDMWFKLHHQKCEYSTIPTVNNYQGMTVFNTNGMSEVINTVRSLVH